jgi:adenosylcobalamin-dependent ribonucleoside-triphosphate reductase
MDLSMLGIGVGFDVRGAGTCPIYQPERVNTENAAKHVFIIGDSREGWVASTVALIESFMRPGSSYLTFDYSNIRPEGTRLKTFGGVAPGPEPLKELHQRITSQLNDTCNSAHVKGRQATLGIEDITNICNMIGKCVFSGNVRRSAEIAFGPSDDEEYLDLKDYEKNPHRAEFGWLSNNSIFAELGQDYSKVVQRTHKNGEPGYFWLDNARKHGRMTGRSSDRARTDPRAYGGNPCLGMGVQRLLSNHSHLFVTEQTLEKKEVCNLVETMVDRHNDVDDLCVTLKYAYLFAKTVSLCPIHWKDTDQVVQRNRRIGTSMTGIVQCLHRIGRQTFIEWCERGYKTLEHWDFVYSKWLDVRPSIKLTSVKPSGTVSLLSGSTPGVHAPISNMYIRRVTLPNISPLLPGLKKAGYSIVRRKGQTSSCLVEFPVRLDIGSEESPKIKTQSEENFLDVLDRAALLQRYWADNQVSVTVTFDPEKVSQKDLAAALDIYQYRLKGVSFLPLGNISQYEYPPYEDIDEAEYERRIANLKPIDWSNTLMPEPDQPKYCTNDGCVDVSTDDAIE